MEDPLTTPVVAEIEDDVVVMAEEDATVVEVRQTTSSCAPEEAAIWVVVVVEQSPIVVGKIVATETAERMLLVCGWRWNDWTRSRFDFLHSCCNGSWWM